MANDSLKQQAIENAVTRGVQEVIDKTSDKKIPQDVFIVYVAFGKRIIDLYEEELKKLGRK